MPVPEMQPTPAASPPIGPAVPSATPPVVLGVPLWQQLSQDLPPSSPREETPTEPPAPPASPEPLPVTPVAGLSPGNFTRTTPLVPQLPGAERKSPRLAGEKGRRWGVLVGALFCIGLALAGAGWFFKDQVKVFWDRTLTHFHLKETDDAGTVDPAVAALLNQKPKGAAESSKAPEKSAAAAKPATPAASKSQGGESVASTTPAKPPVPATSPARKETSPGSKEPAASTPTIAGTTEIVPPPPPPPPVEVTRKPEIPSAALVEIPKTTEPAPVPADEPPVKKALPVDSRDSPMRRSTEALPETLAPIPPAPPTPSSPGLVEVASNAKGAVMPAALAGEERPIFIKSSGEARPAAEILSKFFQAKTWQERLTLTQPEEKIRTLMERYYAGNPDGPIRVSSIELIRHEKAPEIGTPLCVFQVSGADLSEPLPVMVESTREGWKVDWITFTEFKDKLLLRFLQKWQDEPARFHVMVRRTHYFDEDVPGLDKRHCFELMPPTPGYSGFAFVSKGTSLAQNLDRTIGWEIANIAAIVELQWHKQDRFQWVEITAVPQFNWRTLPAIPVAQPAKLAPENGNETLLATPASPVKPPAVAEKK